MKIDFSFVPFPREIWTENIDLSQVEFRLLGWFCCNIKFGISQPKFADHEILNGCKVDGITYPKSGLSKNSLRRAREALMERGMLTAIKKADGGGRGNTTVWEYSLNLSNSDRFIDKPSQLGPETVPTWTLNPPNLDPVIRNIERTEESELILSPPSEASGNRKSQVKVKVPDPRHQPFKKLLEAIWVHMNPELPPANWDAGDAGQLGRFLTRWKTLDMETFKFWLQGYYESKNTNRAHRPKQFLPRLHDFAYGPRGKYNELEENRATV